MEQGIGIAAGASAPRAARAMGVRGAAALGFAAFLVVSGLVSLGYRKLAGPPYVAVMSEKLEDYAAHAQDYDIVFLGSSQTFRHIDPSVVDHELEACEAPARSYNFGVPALREPELRYLVDELLARKSDRLRLVVVQNPLRTEAKLSNLMTDRGRWFRGWDRLGDAGRDVACYTGTPIGLVRRIFNNARAVIAEQIGLGRLSQALVPGERPEEGGYDPRYRTADGFWPVDRDEVDPAPYVPITDDMIAEAREGTGYAPSRFAAACRAGQLLDTVRKLEAHGLDVVYFVSPDPREVGTDRAVGAALAEADPDLPVLAYNDPAAHPELFQIGLWHDMAHLGGDGARLVSRAVGRDLCAVMKGRG